MLIDQETRNKIADEIGQLVHFAYTQALTQQDALTFVERFRATGQMFGRKVQRGRGEYNVRKANDEHEATFGGQAVRLSLTGD